MVYDLKDCITTSKLKVNKRLNRLRAVLDMLGEDSDQHIAQMNIQPEVNTVISDQQIMDFLSVPQEPIYNPIVYEPDNEIDDAAKKAIEAELTSKLNADGHLYKTTCRNLTSVLVKQLRRNIYLNHLFQTRRLFVVHKGSVAMRYALLKQFPDKRPVIDEWFKLGGDNDVCIMIDPTLEDFDSVHHKIVQLVHKFLNDKTPAFGEGCVATLAKKVRYLKVGNIHMKVTPDVRQSFAIHTAANGDKIQVNDVAKYPVYTSYNELSFKDEIGRRSEFTLIRAKQAFRVTPKISENVDIDISDDHPGRICAAEIVDVSIPSKYDMKNADGFHKFASGYYVDEQMRV